MKRFVLLSLAICLCFLTGACKHKAVPAFKVNDFATGKAGEMILVMDTIQWPKAHIQAVYQVLQQPQPAINQQQSMFDVLLCSNKDFLASFTRHRNIVRFDYNPDLSSNSYTLQQDAWATAQVYIHIKGNNRDSCIALFLQHQDEIIRVLYDNDIKRLQHANLKLNNPEIEKKIKTKFGISMTIPARYFIGREEQDFLWLCHRTPKNDRFVMIYRLPAYPLIRDSLVAARNTMTQAYIQGAVAGAYPIVADFTDFPLIHPYRIRYHDGVEMRGLWESVRDKMGGPFYSFTMLSPDKISCITVDGFVYAPQEDKRDYLREVEAIVKSIK